jgi:hypothetical protein
MAVGRRTVLGKAVPGLEAHHAVAVEHGSTSDPFERSLDGCNASSCTRIDSIGSRGGLGGW